MVILFNAYYFRYATHQFTTNIKYCVNFVTVKIINAITTSDMIIKILERDPLGIFLKVDT